MQENGLSDPPGQCARRLAGFGIRPTAQRVRIAALLLASPPAPLRRADSGELAYGRGKGLQGHGLQHPEPVRRAGSDPAAVGGRRPEIGSTPMWPRTTISMTLIPARCWICRFPKLNSRACQPCLRAWNWRVSTWLSGCEKSPEVWPILSTIRARNLRLCGADLAQLVEHIIRNDGVHSSIL